MALTDGLLIKVSDDPFFQLARQPTFGGGGVCHVFALILAQGYAFGERERETACSRLWRTES